MPFPLVTFKGWTCEVQVLRYNNNRPALALIDAANGESIARATVNLPEKPLQANEVFIKDYSENEGILEALVAAKIITPALEWITTGHCQVARCRLVQEVDS